MGKQRIKPTDIFLAILALLLISVSFYQTWLGLDQIFGTSSFVIALVLSLLLLFLIWMLREAKQNGESTFKLMGIYIFIAFFCFIANFNALYTRFMKTNIYETELKEISEKFNVLDSDVNSKFTYLYSSTQRQEIDNKKDDLMQQIQDKGDPGFGTKSQLLIRDIERILGPGKRIDILKVANNDYTDLAERMGQKIDGMVSKLSPDETTLKTDLKIATKKWNEEIQNFLILPQEKKDKIAQSLVDKSLADYNKLGLKASTVLGNDKIKFEIVTSKTQEVGKIGFAFGHAIQNFGVYQFVVLLGCILLDFIIPIIVILVTKPNSTDVNNNYNGSVFTTKRKSNVLIPNN